MKLFYEVYLPVAVTVDEHGKLAGTPEIDWEGHPWSETNNVWTNDRAAKPDRLAEEAEWVLDRPVEEQAEEILRKLLAFGVEQAIIR